MCEYERISGKELNETVKTATLIEEAPPQLKEHLRLRSEELGTHHENVVTDSESYIRSKRSWDTGGQAGMGIGAHSRGKEQYRGKGKHKIKSHGKGDERSRDPKCKRDREKERVKNRRSKSKTLGKKPTTSKSKSVLFLENLDMSSKTASIVLEERMKLLTLQFPQ